MKKKIQTQFHKPRMSCLFKDKQNPPKSKQDTEISEIETTNWKTPKPETDKNWIFKIKTKELLVLE